MADAAALATIAKSAFQLFTSLAKDELLLLWNSGEDLKKLNYTIESISCFLQDAEERKSKDLSVQHFLSKLRKVLYDAEDLFDALAYHVLHNNTATGNAFKKEVRLFFSKSNQLGFLYKTAQEVKSLRESVDEIDKNMQRFSFIQQPPRPLHQSFRREKTHSFVHEEDVIGRDQDKDSIINMLVPKDEGRGQSFSVVAIIGFGGLGKTTLAQLVYNDQRVKHVFDVHLWACVNDLSDLEQVLIEIIASKEGRHRDLGLEKLQEKLREIIGGRRFLIVLDDVWDVSPIDWLNLEKIIRCGKSGSKVLVTTRSTKVAECLDALKSYNLGVLSEESAWSLFQKMAFYEEELNKHPELEQLGKQIVQKCGNVPLAIVTIGSLLRQKEREVKVWTEFLNHKLKDVLLSTDDKTHGSIKDVLKVSYDDLHPNLKHCFASCSLFPKDHRFDKDKLVRLWLSQGFLKPTANNEESLEELGETYFFELVQRCFFQEVEYMSSWYSYNCTAKMHDLLHDLAIDVAKTEIFYLDKLPEDRMEIDGLRHISIGYKVDYGCLVSYPKTMRTLLFHHGGQLSKSSLDMLLERFRMMRTLCLPNLGIDHVSDSIGELIHLRYLDLSGNDKLKHLPKSICKLHQLMVFILRGCELLEKLPPKLEKLVRLRQLYIEGCDRLDSLPPGLKALTSLVNLDRVIVHCHSGGLGYLNELDNLCGSMLIELPGEGWADAIEDAKKSNMSKKHKLNGMVIEWKGKDDSAQKLGKDETRAVMEALEPHISLQHLAVKDYGGEMLPGWLCTLKLKNVTELFLSGCDQVEYIEDEIKGKLCFPSLKMLSVKGMTNLKGWWRQEIGEETQRPRLPKVSKVAIRSCPELKGQMPLMEGIEYLELDGVDVKLVEELLVLNPNCSSLSSFYLYDIKGLICLREDWIRHLTALQSFSITFCGDLRWVSGRGLAHLTALNRLIVACGEIGDEGDEVENMGNEKAGMPWKALQGLEFLNVAVGDKHLVEGLQYLTQLEELNIEKWIKAEEDNVDLNISHSLQNLSRLSIGFDGKACHLPKSGIQYLHSLRHLQISDCKELYMGWKTLLSMKLVSLNLYRVERVIDVEDDMMMTAGEQQSLLRDLYISGGAWEKWVDDIPWTSLSSSLQHLWLIGMGEREQLPDGIQHLTSLRLLLISGCEKVRSLPNWIPQLTSLSYLKIKECSEELKRRCERERGEDWPLIRHIRSTYIRAEGYVPTNANVNESSEEEGSKKMGWCGLNLSKF